jgi:hypothetical protein
MVKAEVPEDWEKEKLIPAPGRVVYIGQGKVHYVYFHQWILNLLRPKNRRKKKKKPPLHSQLQHLK